MERSKHILITSRLNNNNNNNNNVKVRNIFRRRNNITCSTKFEYSCNTICPRNTVDLKFITANGLLKGDKKHKNNNEVFMAFIYHHFGNEML